MFAAAELAQSAVDFNQVWIECAIINPTKGFLRNLPLSPIPAFLKPDPKFEKVEFSYDETSAYSLSEKKECLIDVDLWHKSDRLVRNISPNILVKKKKPPIFE